jgi:hypothetical protein
MTASSSWANAVILAAGTKSVTFLPIFALTSAPSQRRCAYCQEITAFGVFDGDVIGQIVDQRAEQVAFSLELFLDLLISVMSRLMPKLPMIFPCRF